MRTLLATSCLLTALACGGGDDRPPADTPPAAEQKQPPPATTSAPQVDQADLERYWQLMRELAAAADTTGDCPSKGAAMAAVLDGGSDLLERRTGLLLNQELAKQWARDYGARADELMRDLFDRRLADCLDDPAVAAAMKRLAE